MSLGETLELVALFVASGSGPIVGFVVGRRMGREESPNVRTPTPQLVFGDPPLVEIVRCSECCGSRECEHCEGDGIVHGVVCRPCRGSGNCGECGGTGRERL